MVSGPTAAVAGPGSYSTAEWSVAPPPVLRSVLSASGGGALIQFGHSLDGRASEVSVPASNFDVLLLAGADHDFEGRIGDETRQIGARGPDGVYFCAGLPSRWVCKPHPRHPLVTHLHIPTSLRDDALEDCATGGPTTAWLSRGSPIIALATHLRASLERGDQLTSIELDSYAMLVVRHWARIVTHFARTSRLAGWQLRRVTDLLQGSLASDLPLADLAAEVRLSPFHFARCFKATTGQAPHRFLISLRLERARELLEHTDLAISDVAAQIGYDDPSYFARLFRGEVGVSPLRYRQKRQR